NFIFNLLNKFGENQCNWNAMNTGLPQFIFRNANFFPIRGELYSRVLQIRYFVDKPLPGLRKRSLLIRAFRSTNPVFVLRVPRKAISYAGQPAERLARQTPATSFNSSSKAGAIALGSRTK